MEVGAILRQLHSVGVSVTLDGDELVCRPGSKVPADLVPVLKQHKTGVVERLRFPDGRYRRVRPDDTPEEGWAEMETQVLEYGACLLWSDVLQDYVGFYLTEKDRAKVPPGFVPYSDDELRRLFGPEQPDWTPDALRRIHGAKKTGADITNVKTE